MFFATLARGWADQKAALSQLRAIVVDDEEALSALLREVLQDAGFSVETHSRAEPAFRSICDKPFNLLIVDKNLPDRTGLSLITQVKQLGIDLPSVVITGYASIASIAEAFMAGASDYIAKPFDDIEHVARRLKSIAETRVAKQYYGRIVSDLERAAPSDPADRAALDALTAEVAHFKEALRHRLAVLVIDPNAARAHAVAQALNDRGIRTEIAGEQSPSMASLRGENAPLVAVISLDVPKPSTFIFEARAAEPLTEIIAVCDRATLPGALAAVEAGAADFVDVSVEHASVLRARTVRLLALARISRLHVFLVAALYRRVREQDPTLADGLISVLPAEQRRYLEHLLQLPAQIAAAPSATTNLSQMFTPSPEEGTPPPPTTAASPATSATDPGGADTRRTTNAIDPGTHTRRTTNAIDPGVDTHPTTSPAGLDAAADAHRARLVDLGTAAAELAHELNEPVGGLKAHAEFLLDHQDAKQVRERAKRMLVQIERLERLCSRTLAYVRKEAPAPALLLCELNLVAQATYDLVTLGLDARTRIELHLDPDDPVARADALAVQQILLNLVNNAKAATAGKEALVRIATRRRGGEVEIEVEDDGPGIAAALRGKLFSAFVTNKPEAAGLGLYISRRLARAAGGDLDLIESARGAHFRLRLPGIN